MSSSLRSTQLLQAALVALIACTPPAQSSSADSPAPQADVKADTSGWRALFDGGAPTQWRAYHADSVPAAWYAKDGALTKDVGSKDLITRDQFGDFELTLDWRLSTGGNAGIFYRGTQEYDHIYWSAPEYQLLDDANAPDGKSRLTSAAAAYALYPSPAGIVKPAGEWNSSRIVVNGAHVEHWLNGQKVVQYELWSPDWEAKVK